MFKQQITRPRPKKNSASFKKLFSYTTFKHFMPCQTIRIQFSSVEHKSSKIHSLSLFSSVVSTLDGTFYISNSFLLEMINDHSPTDNFVFIVITSFSSSSFSSFFQCLREHLKLFFLFIISQSVSFLCSLLFYHVYIQQRTDDN